ncbi:MAG TPA: cob(I)yrinic acid a,c-diamide adenosyltransferase [Polyangiaceae bacterium]|jgi:cob(I)alamin adenosyltransferase|nr:MAG: Cob(I)yrinic acid a,c-diamide adenosyltransferase [Deltaproteobacteria bacterium ADurb.Bin207]HNS98218.1 cob(I)yrinic acid a,c-diamide adenosyltransferase [Polyangiaceae bacterium]HNZ20538.1 cob(I)yrinic acid a,c-diamide adenosyltransferase [Polyangiaceae bacterium]HOD24854.1 cob(I)yrinic acid a,c-diamide adenosyltransferase [Polyangiaceae bacterium]HOE47266.1 cob(I)yrinic acid a,c-diamide adenosyltransferase [Polyangiaceae bacterium]
MKIYTRTGDDGTTSLFGGKRVSKAGDRVEAYGVVDEANSILGLARAMKLDPWSDEVLQKIQRDLFTLGAEIASGRNAQSKLRMPLIGSADVQRIEKAIDEAEQQLAPLHSFILPGGSLAASTLHLARTVVRRAERMLVALSNSEPVRQEILEYINRASDLMFVLARLANMHQGVEDVPWLPDKG